MARVTDAEVKALTHTTADTTPQIQTATLIVDEELLGHGLSEARLKEIELYLAAHFVIIAERGGGLIETKVGESGEVYNKPKAGPGFAATNFGMQAVALDPTGRLAGLSTGKPTAQFRVV